MNQITDEDLRKIAAEVEREYGTGGLSGGTLYEDFAVDVAKRAIAMERERCPPDSLMFDAFGEPRTRYVRVTLDGSHCVMHPSEGDRHLQDAREADDSAADRYTVRDVWLSEREFDDLPEFDGF